MMIFEFFLQFVNLSGRRVGCSFCWSCCRERRDC